MHHNVDDMNEGKMEYVKFRKELGMVFVLVMLLEVPQLCMQILRVEELDGWLRICCCRVGDSSAPTSKVLFYIFVCGIRSYTACEALKKLALCMFFYFDKVFATMRLPCVFFLVLPRPPSLINEIWQ